MRIFKNKWFAKFAKKEGISNEKLIHAVRDIDAGNIDVNYGSGVIKQRIGRLKEGKSGGYRTIIIFRKGDRAFFVYGFAKSDIENIDAADVRGFKKLAKILLSFAPKQLDELLENGEIEEIE